MKKLYEAVPVEEALPTEENYYGVLAVGYSCPMMREWDGRKFNSPVQSEIVTHWLREVEVGSSVSTEEAIIDFAMWYSGMERGKVESAFERYKREVLRSRITAKEKEK